jgi:formate--tetrahydrofolate ligase
VIVATVRAIKHHGGVPEKPESLLEKENHAALRKGLVNLSTHVRNVSKFGAPVIVAVNRYSSDTAEELKMIESLCGDLGVEYAIHDAYVSGGEGATELAEKAVRLADANDRTEPRYLYDLEIPVEGKIECIAKEIYGADGVHIEKRAQKKIERFSKLGYGDLPVCIAKTSSSLTDNPRAIGAPKGWTLTVTDAHLSAGAGFLVAVCGDIMLMPGLPKVPAAAGMDIDDHGRVVGLF